MKSKSSDTKKIVIFASGEGSNTKNIIEHFDSNPTVRVQAVFSNKYNAPVMDKADDLGIRAISFDRQSFYYSHDVFHIVQDYDPDLIVLAGFMWLMPERFVEHFDRRIINLHPSLLPKYGGKGMYGNHVHKAVVKAGEAESGITVHYVDKNFDEGEIIEQHKVKIEEGETPESLKDKIKNLEQMHFPKVIEKLLHN